MINEYKKIYERVPKDDKSDSWRQHYDPKKFWDLDYQPVKLETESMVDENESNIKQSTQLKQLDVMRCQNQYGLMCLERILAH